MAYEFGEMDARIFVAILRIVCAVVGIACLVEWGGGLMSWLGNDSSQTSIWKAMVGEEPYCRLSFRSVQMGGGILWKMTPNGMLPALNLIGFSLSVLWAAIYSRWWQWALAAVGGIFLSL